MMAVSQAVSLLPDTCLRHPVFERIVLGSYTNYYVVAKSATTIGGNTESSKTGSNLRSNKKPENDSCSLLRGDAETNVCSQDINVAQSAEDSDSKPRGILGVNNKDETISRTKIQVNSNSHERYGFLNLELHPL